MQMLLAFTRASFVVALLLVGASLGGCGSSEGEASTSAARETTRETTQKAATTTERQAPPKRPKEVHEGSWALLKKTAGDAADRLLLPRGPAPEKVLVRELERGHGRMVRRGDFVTVAYKGFSYVTGQQTLEQWEAPFSWTYGLGELFYGLEPGLEGMRVGGVRELIAPSRLTHETGATVLYVTLRKTERQ